MYNSANFRRARQIRHRSCMEATVLMELLKRPVGRAMLQNMLHDVSLETLIKFRIDSNLGALVWRDLGTQAIIPVAVGVGNTNRAIEETGSNVSQGSISDAQSNDQVHSRSCLRCTQQSSTSSGVQCSSYVDHEWAICKHQENTGWSSSDSLDNIDSLVGIAEAPKYETRPSDAYIPWRQNSEWQPFTGKNSLLQGKLLTRVCSSTNMSRTRAELIFRNHNFGLPPHEPCAVTSNCTACVLGRGRKIAYNFSALLKRKRHLILQIRYDNLLKDQRRILLRQQLANMSKSQRNQRKSRH